MESREIEKLLIRLNRVSSDITISVNYGKGSPTKAQQLEQKRVAKKLSKAFNLDYDYLMDRLTD